MCFFSLAQATAYRPAVRLALLQNVPPSSSPGDEFASIFLIRHSAQVNAATVGAVETPLHLVCSFSPKKHSAEVMTGMAKIADALLKTGANPNMQNSKGR